jgi:uncharacterized protein
MGAAYRSRAVVPTDAGARYAKQLLSHLGRKAAVEQIVGSPEGGRLVFGYGTGTVRPDPHGIVLLAEAEDAEALARVQDVLQRHLERFGARRELTVTWEAT